VNERTETRVLRAKRSLTFIDTSTLTPRAAKPVGTYSRYNLLHSGIILGLVREIAHQFSLTNPSEKIGIVSRYAAQTKLIQALINAEFDGHVRSAATVHRFQGNEKHTMIVDLTDSEPAGRGQYVKDTENFEEGARLINVAVSRAQENLVLVADIRHLQKTEEFTIVKRLLAHFRRYGQELDIERLLGLDTLPPSWEEIAASSDSSLQKYDIVEATLFPRLFRKELREAKDIIVVASPIITRKGLKRWLPELEAAVERGVAVQVLTRSPEAQGDTRSAEAKQAITNLRRAGVQVDCRSSLDEALAFTDGEIVWEGTHNILSHKQRDLGRMSRLVSASACRQVADFMSPPSQDGRTEEFRIPENPKCPRCSRHTVLQSGQYGVYFTCEDPRCDGKIDSSQVRRGRGLPRDEKQETSGKQTLVCTQCGGLMILKKGRYGRFYGCSNYPRCKHTRNA